MTKEPAYPVNLAQKILSYLQNQNIHIRYQQADFTSLFETMFFSSLKTEEGQAIVFEVAYIDDHENQSLGSITWSLNKLEESVKFTIPNVVKLAKASDPNRTSLAISFQGGQLYIIGLIDYVYSFQDFLNYESSNKSGRPGLFQAIVDGPGNIAVYSQKNIIAELRTNKFAEKPVDVFLKGPIYSKLSGYKRLLKNFEGDQETITNEWFNTIRRLILRIKNYRHGGAFVFSAPPFTDINLKYQIEYKRLKKNFENRAGFSERYEEITEKIQQHINNGTLISKQLFNEYSSLFMVNEMNSKEMDACLEFISSLSRVDGTIAVDQDFIVRGFGGEIVIMDNTQPNAFLCSEMIPNNSNSESIEIERYGTRHRSMIRYCATHKNSVGFVISQDGDVRAITSFNDNVYMWENLKLQNSSPALWKTTVSYDFEYNIE